MFSNITILSLTFDHTNLFLSYDMISNSMGSNLSITYSLFFILSYPMPSETILLLYILLYRYFTYPIYSVDGVCHTIISEHFIYPIHPIDKAVNPIVPQAILTYIIQLYLLLFHIV